MCELASIPAKQRGTAARALSGVLWRFEVRHGRAPYAEMTDPERALAARIQTLVFGARDLRFGGVRSKFQIADSPLLNHRVEVIEGVLGAESTAMLQRFFNGRRTSR